MAARKRAAKPAEGSVHRLDRFGKREEIAEQDVVEEPQPALPGQPTE